MYIFAARMLIADVLCATCVRDAFAVDDDVAWVAWVCWTLRETCGKKASSQGGWGGAAWEQSPHCTYSVCTRQLYSNVRYQTRTLLAAVDPLCIWYAVWSSGVWFQPIHIEHGSCHVMLHNLIWYCLYTLLSLVGKHINCSCVRGFATRWPRELRSSAGKRTRRKADKPIDCGQWLQFLKATNGHTKQVFRTRFRC